MPAFEHDHEGTDSYELTSLARGGEQLVKLSEELCQSNGTTSGSGLWQPSLVTWDEALKITNRCVDATEHANIPRLELAPAYIITALDREIEKSPLGQRRHRRKESQGKI